MMKIIFIELRACVVEHLYFYQPAELDVYKRNKSNII